MATLSWVRWWENASSTFSHATVAGKTLSPMLEKPTFTWLTCFPIFPQQLHPPLKHICSSKKMGRCKKSEEPWQEWAWLSWKVHRFVAGDWSHPESNKIYEKLNEIHTRLKSAIGYSADTGNVLLDMEEEDKEHALAVHSEKLAIAYGLLHLDSKEAIRIVKNLRVCRDCHHVTKLISKVYGREIIVRDRNRFHHFEDGECSCLDFW